MIETNGMFCPKGAPPKRALVVLDVIFHGLVEQKPTETVAKFVRYSLPQLIDELTKCKDP